MRINMLFVIAIIILGVTLFSYLVRVLTMIELWQISIALLAVSFGMWFEVHSKYSGDAKKLKGERLDKVRKKIEEICEQRQKDSKEEKMESEMASLTKLYEESNEPIELCEQTWSIFSYAGVCFLASIFCRLGADLLSISQLPPIEALIFFFGMILFAGAILDTRELMKLISSGEDPRIPMFMIFFVAVIQALHLFVIWQLLPDFISLNVSSKIFFTLLFITFIGAGLLLWERGNLRSKKAIFGVILMYSPWIWVMILGLLTYLGYLH